MPTGKLAELIKDIKSSPIGHHVSRAPWWVYTVAMCGGLGFFEAETSSVQSRFFPALAEGKIFTVPRKVGQNVPATGPYNERMGYARADDVARKLENSGFKKEPTDKIWLDREIPLLCHLNPIYDTKPQGGLAIDDEQDREMFESKFPRDVYQKFSDIPRPLIEMLLFVENKELLGNHPESWNYAIEWQRFLYAGVGYGARKLGVDLDRAGGSTLAIQLEKIRFSLDGRTHSGSEKICQAITASTRGYAYGANTLMARQRTIQDYVNAAPLAGHKKFGELIGFSDGMYGIFGIDRVTSDRILTMPHSDINPDNIEEVAVVYRAALSTIMALQRPTVYLKKNPEILHNRVNIYLPLLAKAKIITPELAQAIAKTPTQFAIQSDQKLEPYIREKATDIMRVDIMGKIGASRLADLDKMDMRVVTTLDSESGRAVSNALKSFADPTTAKELGLVAHQLLGNPDAAKNLRMAFTLYEKMGDINVLRIQADNMRGQFNMNEKSKLDLGSTAKMWVLGEILEGVVKLHDTYANKAAEDLAQISIHKDDTLTAWAIDYLQNPATDHSRQGMVDAMLARNFSASMGESFFTGGGLQHFSNFKGGSYNANPTVHESLQKSINLPFIRMMREWINHITYATMKTDHDLFTNLDNPQRKIYLDQFADDEGQVFLRRAWKEQRAVPPQDAADFLVEKIKNKKGGAVSARQIVALITAIDQGATRDDVLQKVRAHCHDCNESDAAAMYDVYGQGKSVAGISTRNDRAYITGLHPLEIELAQRRLLNPELKKWDDVKVALRDARLDSYAWLMKSSRMTAQNRAIRIMLEKESFTHVHNSIRKKGFPFETMEASLSVVLGAAGATPDFLAEYVGIILNDGKRSPKTRYNKIILGENTPYEMTFTPRFNQASQVMPPEVAQALKREIRAVVEKGTARRAFGAAQLSNGHVLQIGGKTGTSDGLLKSTGDSESQGRTATFVFILGEKHFGTMMVNVPADVATGYHFTSALPVEMTKRLIPHFRATLDRGYGVVQNRPESLIKIPAPQQPILELNAPQHTDVFSRMPYAPDAFMTYEFMGKQRVEPAHPK